MKYKIIENDSDLENLAEKLEKEKIIAVDLEADSMFHFKEKVCLIQIATKKESLIIDPLKINDLSPVKPLFFNPVIKKIFHGADYDVRSLHRDFDIEINNIFDTQLASMFLGINKTGLDCVLQSRFKVSVNKKYQRKDWSQRPLPVEMIEYAAMDTKYLIDLAEILEQELKTQNRLFWVNEECEHLSKVRYSSNNNNPLYLKTKGFGKLDHSTLSVFETLLRFRVKIAKKKDKPLFKVLSTNCLKKISIEKPSCIKDLKAMKILGNKQIQMYGDAIINLIKYAIAKPEKNLVQYNPKSSSKISAPDPKIVKALKEWRDKKAKKIKIAPGLLCNNALINAIATEKPKSIDSFAKVKDIKKWRVNTFGEEMLLQIKQAI